MGKKSAKRRNSSESNTKVNTTKAARHGASPEATGSTVSDVLSQTNSVLHGEADSSYTSYMNMSQPTVFPQHMASMSNQLISPQIQSQVVHQQVPVSPIQNGANPIPAQYAYTTTALPGPSNTDIMNCLCKIESRLDKLDNKMKTLENVEQKIDDFDKELKKLWVYVKDNMATNSENTTKLGEQVDNVELAMGLAQDKIVHLEKENGKLKDNMLDLQSRSMRDNLVWGGIDDDPNETPQQTEAKVRQFMCDVLRMEKPRVDEITFERVHRTGYISVAYPKRKIISKFTRFPDKEEVRKLKSRLEGTHYFVHEQFPPEIVAQRRKLIPRLKAAKSEGKRAWISYTTLYIDGQPVKYPA